MVNQTVQFRSWQQAVGLHLHQTLKIFFKIAPASLLCALVYTTYKIDVTPRYPGRINITAKGYIHQPGISAAVWLKSPNLTDRKLKYARIFKSQGWVRKDQILISLINQPAELAMKGYFSKNRTIEFFKTQYSGEVELEINERARRFSLTQSNPEIEIISFSAALKGEKPSSAYIAITFIRLFARSFLLITLVFAFLRPIYLSIPSTASSVPEIQIKGTKAILLKLALIATTTLFVIAFYPGVMTEDSYAIYHQALNQQYYDWHPPIMAAVWSITNKIIEGPGGMFILHSIIAFYSLYLLSKVALLRRKTLFFIPQLAIFLPIFTCILFVLWKDVSMTVSFLFAFSLWYYWQATGQMNRWRLLLILTIVFYGSFVRHNAFPAGIPLIFLFTFHSLSKKKALIFACAIGLLFYASNLFITYGVLGASRSHTFQAIMSDDLLEIYLRTGKNYFPPIYLTKAQLNDIAGQVYRDNPDPTIPQSKAQLTSDPAKISALRKSWIDAIKQEPFEYLRHRFKFLLSFLEVPTELFQLTSTNVPDFMRNEKKPLLIETWLGKIHAHYLYWTNEHLTFLFAFLPYLVVSLFILAFSIHRKIVSAICLSSSSLLYFGTIFVGGLLIHYRNGFWIVVATLLSVFVLWIEIRPKEIGHADQSFTSTG